VTKVSGVGLGETGPPAVALSSFSGMYLVEECPNIPGPGVYGMDGWSSCLSGIHAARSSTPGALKTLGVVSISSTDVQMHSCGVPPGVLGSGGRSTL